MNRTAILKKLKRVKQGIELIISCFVFFSFSLALAGAPETQSLSLPEVWTAEKAVRFAIHNNPDSKIGWQRIEAANAAISLQKAALYPTVSINSQYGQTDNAMYSFGNILNQGAFSPTIDFNNPGRTDSLNAGVRFDYRLYDGGRDQAGLRAARAQGEALQMELQVVHARLALEVVRAFYLITQAEEMIKSREAMVRAIDASLETAQARYEEGVVLRADLLDLQVQIAGARENLIRSRKGLELSEQIFLNLLGLPDQEVKIAPMTDREQQVPQNRGYEKRPELKSIDAMIEGAREQLRQATGGYSPVVNGYAGYDLEKGTITGGSGDSWQAGIRLQYDLFDGHRTAAEVSRATARIAEAEERRRKTELAIALEVKQAEIALREAEERLAVTEKTVEQAMESARINRERFREGLILAADLITVENRLTDAQVRRTFAQTSRRIAAAELRRALGLPQFDDFEGDSTANE
jgi:outer membrane protein